MIKKFVILGILLAIIPLLGATCNAQVDASEYSPILYFEGQETCYPIDANYHLDNSEKKCISTLLEETCYYDNIHGTVSDDGVITNYQSVKDSYETVVYYRTYPSGGTDVIQYWMFYAFNNGELNRHEGDWEMVQIVFEGSSPSWVAYSQHYSGQRATWNQVEKDGNHIKVYVSRGSHANYLRSYSGKLGVASDIVGANGEVINPSIDYTLYDIEDQTTWIDFAGRWGEVPDSAIGAAAASFLGEAGPEGPKYRTGSGSLSLWDDPIAWGTSLPEANDLMFIAEWFFYNFVLIFALITALSLGLTAFFIYRRHKKYGLGPRIFSFLYIDGFNLKSIGNILFIVGIIIAILGLFYSWYSVSIDLSSVSSTLGIQTTGMQDIISIDGLNGVQVSIPGENGFMPVGTMNLPFSLFLGIGLLYLIIATIGIPLSKKLGFKYIWRGVRLLVPVILIIVVVAALGSIVPASMFGGTGIGSTMSEILSSISGSPLGNQVTYSIPLDGSTELFSMQWGIGLGLTLLLIGAIIFIISGILEILANTQFFATKIPLPGQAPLPMQYQPPLVPQQPPAQQQPVPPPPQAPPEKPKGKSKTKFCDKCGNKLEENATFCVKCGNKIE